MREGKSGVSPQGLLRAAGGIKLGGRRRVGLRPLRRFDMTGTQCRAEHARARVPGCAQPGPQGTASGSGWVLRGRGCELGEWCGDISAEWRRRHDGLGAMPGG